MNLILIHHQNQSGKERSSGFVQSGFSCIRLGDIVRDGLIDNSAVQLGSMSKLLAVPEDWACSFDSEIYYNSKLHIKNAVDDLSVNEHLVVSNGNYILHVNGELLSNAVSACNADVVAVNINEGLAAYGEYFRFGPDNQIAGCRRLYSDSVNQTVIPADWPHYLFIKKSVISEVINGGYLPLEFSSLMEKCKSGGLKVRAVNIGGSVLDLNSEDGFLSLILQRLKKQAEPVYGENCRIAEDARVTGEVILGDNVKIESKAVVLGPVFIGDNAVVSKGAVINSSVIASGVTVPAGRYIQSRVIRDNNFEWNDLKNSRKTFVRSFPFESTVETQNKWPMFSYPIFFKRIIDMIFSFTILLLFAPVFPIVAIALKVNSPGPLFYRARRQGRGGREFDCLKFRTMIVGADKMQDQLRCVNQIDGPQFKMSDDPRISKVGRFLRNTCIDEIPQFINVILGQMSVVGPRPSPESENTLCPSWRDIRLMVRPGITGLWQVCRTREPSRDFQEWIHFDTEYVKGISFKKDLWICWKTATHLIRTFLKQF